MNEYILMYIHKYHRISSYIIYTVCLHIESEKSAQTKNVKKKERENNRVNYLLCHKHKSEKTILSDS